MKTKLLAMMLLAGSSMFAQTRFSVGIGLGGLGAGLYQPPPSYASNIPPCPGPDYTWIDGYWSQDYGRSTWVAGYWDRQPFTSRYPAAPYFDNRFNGDGDRRSVTRSFDQERDRGFDQGRTREFRRNQNQIDRPGNRNGSNGADNHGNGNANGFRGR